MIEDSMSDTPEVAHEIQTDELSPVSAGDHPSFPSVPIVSKLYTNANCQAIWEIWLWNLDIVLLSLLKTKDFAAARKGGSLWRVTGWLFTTKGEMVGRSAGGSQLALGGTFDFSP